MSLYEYMIANLQTGSIQEISSIICDYYRVGDIKQIRTEDKLEALCFSENIDRRDLDEMIADNPPAIRTIKGHAFEVVFSKILQINDIPHREIGGDTDFDFEILGNTLQLKTQYVKGCRGNLMAYKTHKTHGAKSEDESLSYYHLVDDFADYLIGLISYDPFQVFIIPREDLPRHREDDRFLASPFQISTNEVEYINNFRQLGISDDLIYPPIVNRGSTELLPVTADTIGVRSNYIVDAIFQPENFRIWDMNLRGFIREAHIKDLIMGHGIQLIDPREITERPEKVDLALRHYRGGYTRFQIKGLTFAASRFRGFDSEIVCETQLSRGRVNDHPTQSRLYLTTDFDVLLIAMDPVYTNTFTKECYGVEDFNWSIYAIPAEILRTHHLYSNRLASNQIIRFADLQRYRIDDDWYDQWQ